MCVQRQPPEAAAAFSCLGRRLCLETGRGVAMLRGMNKKKAGCKCYGLMGWRGDFRLDKKNAAD